MKDWLLARLSERSTWLGITGFLTAAGIYLDPEQIEAIAVAGLAVAGVVGVFTKDKAPPA